MNQKLLIEKPPLFYEIYYAKERIIRLQGGTSSGKTYTALDVLFCLAIEQPNQVITVVGQDVPNLKKGAFRDAKRIYYESEIYQQHFNKPNETDRVFTCNNGSIIEFSSFADEQDAKSGKRDYLFVNEANGINYLIYWQLSIRTRKKIILDYNPTFRFWAHEIDSKDLKSIISDHRNNPYLSQDEHDRIESIKDPELFKVYARGLTGKIEGLIYNNWNVVDEMPVDFKNRWIGLDFGFTNDPTTIIDFRISNGEIWLDELEYKTGMLNSDIIQSLIDNDLFRVDIIADSAEPKSIAEIKSKRFRIEGANKGADSIRGGIDVLKRYKINITSRSTNLKKELLSYKWKVDKNGLATNEPIDDFNHALDAVRYVALNRLLQKVNRVNTSATF
jgi:phage terminase large subunit